MSYPLPFFYFLPIPLRSFKYRPCISYYFSSCSFQYFLSHNVLFISHPFISHHFSFFPIPSFSILYILILCFLSRFNIYFPFFIALFLSFTSYSVLSSYSHPIPSLHNYFPSYPVLWNTFFLSLSVILFSSYLVLLTHILPIPSYSRIFFLSRPTYAYSSYPVCSHSNL